MWIAVIVIVLILFVVIIANTKSETEEFVPNYSDSAPTPDYENSESFEVTGVHIVSRKNYIISYCSIFDEVELIHEKNNKYSKRAIAVKHDGRKIGYIPEYNVEEVHKILKKDYEANIEEINYDGSYLSVHALISYD